MKALDFAESLSVLDNAGLHTIRQLIGLIHLSQEHYITPTQLAQRLHLSTASITAILDLYTSLGLAVRTRTNEDRRYIHVVITAKGRKLLKNYFYEKF